MKTKINIGSWLLGAFCFSFLAALIIPLAIWILTYIFLGFSALTGENIDFFNPVYIIIGVILWLRYSRGKSSIKDSFGKKSVLDEIGIFIASSAIYSVSIGIIFFIVVLGLNFILSLFAGDQYNLLNWFYDLPENSRWALMITCGIFFQILAPYDWENNKEKP